MRSRSKDVSVATRRKRVRPRWVWLGFAVAASLGAAAPAAAAPFLYVADEAGGTVQEYDAASGALAPLRSAGVTGVNPLAVAVTPDGTSVYVVNSDFAPARGSISQYDVQADGSLRPKTQRTIFAGAEPDSIAVNPDGRAVYVTNFTDDTVSQYDIGPGGVLTATIPPTVATGGHPESVAVTPDGKSVYVAAGGGVSQYSVGTGDTLTPKKPPTVAAGSGPEEVAVSPDGKSAYVTDFGNTVAQFDIGAGGALRAKSRPTVATGNFPVGIAVSPDSRNVYVADHGDGQIAQYAATAQGLVLKTPETIAAATGPLDLAASPDGKHLYGTDNLTPPSGSLLEYDGGNGPGTLVPIGTGSVPFFSSPGSQPSGIAIGPLQIRFSCGIVLRFCTIGTTLAISGGSTTAVTFRTTAVRAAQLGILVQRLIGRRRVTIGRVPLGPQPTGRLKLRWNLRVNGHRLANGHYLLTLRIFDHERHLIALAHPVSITIR